MLSQLYYHVLVLIVSRTPPPLPPWRLGPSFVPVPVPLRRPYLALIILQKYLSFSLLLYHLLHFLSSPHPYAKETSLIINPFVAEYTPQHLHGSLWLLTSTLNLRLVSTMSAPSSLFEQS